MQAVNAVDFGQAVINERCVRSFAIVNTGAIPFDYEWDVGDDLRLAASPSGGRIGVGERASSELTFKPTAPGKLVKHPAALRILHSNTYSLLLSGAGHRPKLFMSFFSHDFGAVYEHADGAAPHLVELKLRNDDARDISVAVGGVSGEALAVEGVSVVLAKGQEHRVAFMLRPCGLGPYSRRVPVEVNGLYTVNVDVRATVVALAVDVADASIRTFALGLVKAGGLARTYAVPIINRARIPVDVDFAPSAALAEQYGLTFEPCRVTLKPRETLPVTVKWTPKRRMRSFKEAVTVTAHGVQRTLLTLTGASLGTEVKLGTGTLPFGTVVLGSATSKRLMLSNTGAQAPQQPPHASPPPF